MLVGVVYCALLSCVLLLFDIRCYCLLLSNGCVCCLFAVWCCSLFVVCCPCVLLFVAGVVHDWLLLHVSVGFGCSLLCVVAVLGLMLLLLLCTIVVRCCSNMLLLMHWVLFVAVRCCVLLFVVVRCCSLFVVVVCGLCCW